MTAILIRYPDGTEQEQELAGQLTVGNRVKYGSRCGASASTRNMGAQLCMMRAYIADRYGTAARALSFHRSHGWY